MKTAKQRVKEHLSATGEYPTLDQWLAWGYSEKYYYEVKRNLKKEGVIE